jgi:trimeric autotransporter adhesin
VLDEACSTGLTAGSSVKDRFEAVPPPRLQSATAQQQRDLAAFDTETTAVVDRILSEKRRASSAPATIDAHVSAVQAATANSTEHTLLCEQALAWIARQPLTPKVSARYSSKIMQEYMLVQKRALEAARPSSDSPRSANVREPVADVAEQTGAADASAVAATAAAAAAAPAATAAVKELAHSVVNDIVESMTGSSSQLVAAAVAVDDDAAVESSGTDATVQTAATATTAATTQTSDNSTVELVIDTDEPSSSSTDSSSNGAIAVQDVLATSVVDANSSSSNSSSISSSSKPAASSGQSQSLLAMSIGNLARSFSNAKNSGSSGAATSATSFMTSSSMKEGDWCMLNRKGDSPKAVVQPLDAAPDDALHLEEAFSVERNDTSVSDVTGDECDDAAD